MKIIADAAIPHVLAVFADLGEIELVPGREITPSVLHDAEVLLVRTVTTVDRALLTGTPVRYVASTSSGVDHVDLAYLQDSDIRFFHAPGCNAPAVCEYVLSSLFGLDEQAALDMNGWQIGIIGYGHVGSSLAGQLRALGLSVHVYDPFILDAAGGYPFREIEEIMRSDVISLHVPLTDTGPYPTRHLVDAAFLQQLKDAVILINTARGEVIDEQALMDSLAQRPRMQVVLDVWTNEPHINTALLERASIATPHIAGYSLDARRRATCMVYDQLLACMGRPRPPRLPELPIPALAEVKLAADTAKTDLTLIKKAVLSSYDVRVDSAALHRLIELPAPSPGDLFDALRANYPPRYGFAHRQVALSGEADRLQDTLCALGFQVSII